MNELKPCPFCGGEKIQFHISGHFQPWKNRGMELWYSCACYECGAVMDNGCCKDMKKAIEAWNARADNADNQ